MCIVLLIYRIRKRIKVAMTARAEMIDLSPAVKVPIRYGAKSLWLLITHQRNTIGEGSSLLLEMTTAPTTIDARLTASETNAKNTSQ